MSRFLYTCLFYLCVPLVLARLFYRSLREPRYRADLAQRFGYFRSARPGEIIWVHAVSAGETIAVAPLVRRLVSQGFPCLVTNMTPTGRERVESLLGTGVENAYAPYDLPGALARFLAANRPRLLVVVDTELWPNMLHAAEAAGVPAALVNGRLSARSARRYSSFPGTTGAMLETLDVIAVQTRSHAARFMALGARRERLHVTGSIKFDAEPAGDHADRTESARQLTAGRPVLLGASTHAGEEAALLEACRQARALLPDLLLVLAPRHTHRCDEVAGLIAGQQMSLTRFTDDRSVEKEEVLLIDTMGELDAFFDIARLAFVGGSLVPVGGHNLLEAVRAHTPVVMGSHLDNIDDIARQFLDAGAMLIARDARHLSEIIIELMPDDDALAALATSADAVLEDNRGSLERTEKLLISLLG